MANADKPRGFMPVKHLTGGQIRTTKHVVSTATGTVLYHGDLVSQEAGGNIEAAAADDGLAVIGVFNCCEYIDANGVLQRSNTMPATKTSFTAMWAYIWSDPYIVFRVQADTGTTLTVAAVGATANHVAGSGNATTQLSGHELDASDVGTGAQLEILELEDRPDNVWGEHCDLLVLINEHKHKAAVAGI